MKSIYIICKRYKYNKIIIIEDLHEYIFYRTILIVNINYHNHQKYMLENYFHFWIILTPI